METKHKVVLFFILIVLAATGGLVRGYGAISRAEGESVEVRDNARSLIRRLQERDKPPEPAGRPEHLEKMLHLWEAEPRLGEGGFSARLFRP